ncbi:MAG: transposase [Lachnospiraceae bacterium]
MVPLFRHISTVQVQKKGSPTEIGHSRGGASAKIYAVVDAYGNPVQLMISEGQRNDIVYAIPLLEHIKIPESSQILADRGYDNDQLIDYIYDRGGEPTILSRKSAKFERHCDWWLYKETSSCRETIFKIEVLSAYSDPL